MRIGIEAQRIFRLKKHGMDMVALELIRELQKLDKVNEYFIYVRPDEDSNCIQETDNFKIRLINGNYALWEQIYLPQAIKKDNCQLLHCTSNTAPLFVSTPLIVTLHDIIYMEKSIKNTLFGKGTNYQKFGNLYRRLVVPKIVKKSSRIITVSEFEKRRIAKLFNLSDAKIKAIYNGVSVYFKKNNDQVELERVKIKYNLPDKYFFFLGNTDPKKNTKGLLQALAIYYRKTGDVTPLVILDLNRDFVLRTLKEINEERLIDKLFLTGYIPNTDLPSIYTLSCLFLYPSLRESFGIPMLEAMACGVPVITSNTSSMPEVAGDAALLTDPFKPEEIADAMIELLNNISLQNSLIEKGYVQSAKFTWKAMATQMLSEYNNIINTNI